MNEYDFMAEFPLNGVYIKNFVWLIAYLLEVLLEYMYIEFIFSPCLTFVIQLE